MGKAVLFWKMAQEHKEAFTKEYYDEWLATKLPTADMQDIQLFVDTMRQQNFFKIEPFLPKLYELASHGEFNREIEWIYSYFLRNNKVIIQYLLERWLQDHPQLRLANYFPYEEYEISADLLRKAQEALVKRIISLFQSGDPQQHQNGESYLRALLDNSTKFNYKFLMNLTKHFGTDTYMHVLQEINAPPLVSEYANKQKLSVFDIAHLYNNRQYLDWKELTNIINKTDDKGKEYIRGWLYDEGDGGPSLFMLDGEMRPLNIQYRSIDLLPEDQFYIRRLRNLKNEQVREQWHQMFNDNQVIPQ